MTKSGLRILWHATRMHTTAYAASTFGLESWMELLQPGLEP
jgi:hypothetical protein